MQTGWGTLLLMLGLALSTTGGNAEEGTPTVQDALSSAVEWYNRNSGLDSAFRLLQIETPPDGEFLNLDLQKLEVILKETTCPNSGDLNLDNCDFKEHGVVKECSATSAAQPGSGILQIKCHTVTQGNRRVKRRVRRWKKLHMALRKVYELLLSGGGQPIPQEDEE